MKKLKEITEAILYMIIFILIILVLMYSCAPIKESSIQPSQYFRVFWEGDTIPDTVFIDPVKICEERGHIDIRLHNFRSLICCGKDCEKKRSRYEDHPDKRILIREYRCFPNRFRCGCCNQITKSYKTDTTTIWEDEYYLPDHPNRLQIKEK